MKYIKIENDNNARLFDSYAKDHRAIVKYHAPWCGHCKNLAPKWKSCCNKCGVKMRDVEPDDFVYDDGRDDKFILAEASDSGIPHLKSYNDVQGFPTIAYLERGKKMETYEGEREEDALHSWMKTKMSNKQSGGSKKTKKRKSKSIKKKTQSRNVSYCPHMPPHNGKHLKATKKHIMKINNKNYEVKTCCHACGIVMKSTLKLAPKSFHKSYVAKTRRNHLLLKNKHNGKIVQKAHVVKKRTQRKSSRKMKGGKMSMGVGLGPIKFSKETGKKSWSKNMEAHDQTCYNINGVKTCKTDTEKSKKPWYSFW